MFHEYMFHAKIAVIPPWHAGAATRRKTATVGSNSSAALTPDVHIHGNTQDCSWNRNTNTLAGERHTHTYTPLAISPFEASQSPTATRAFCQYGGSGTAVVGTK